MTKTIYGFALALVLGSTYALGGQGGEGNNTGCNGQGNPNSPCQSPNGNGGSGGNGGAGGSGGQGGQGGSGGAGGNSAQGQLQGQLQAQGQKQGQGQAQGQVGIVSGKNKNNNNNSSRSASNAGASAGSASNSAAVAAGGTSGAISGGNEQSITVEGDKLNYAYKYDNDYAASSAASVYGDVCTGGMSGQVEEGGFAVTNPNAFCNYMAAAMIYREAFEWEMVTGASYQCAEAMSWEFPDGAYADGCMNERASDLLVKYYDNLDNAHEYMEMVEIPAKVDGIFGYLVRPTAVIAALILLL